jgi:hypothetical protein
MAAVEPTYPAFLREPSNPESNAGAEGSGDHAWTTPVKAGSELTGGSTIGSREPGDPANSRENVERQAGTFDGGRTLRAPDTATPRNILFSPRFNLRHKPAWT